VVEFKVVSGTTGNNLPPVIDGLTAPTLLKMGETGTWTIKAHDPENGPLSYKVKWGDESVIRPFEGLAAPNAETFTQTSTFTHSYSSPGIYTPVSTITDNAGLSAQTSASVKVVFEDELNITTGSLPGATVGQAYRTSVYAEGGSNSYSWWISQGKLPPGLELVRSVCFYAAPCKVPVGIAGTPTVAGTYEFTLAVLSGNLSASKTFSITVVGQSRLIPSIKSISPTSCSIGTKVVLTGGNLQKPLGLRVYFGYGYITEPIEFLPRPAIACALNTTCNYDDAIVFRVPEYVQPPMPECENALGCPHVMPQRVKITAGIYKVYVKNQYGESNTALSFTVTSPVACSTAGEICGGIAGIVCCNGWESYCYYGSSGVKKEYPEQTGICKLGDE